MAHAISLFNNKINKLVLAADRTFTTLTPVKDLVFWFLHLRTPASITCEVTAALSHLLGLGYLNHWSAAQREICTQSAIEPLRYRKAGV